MVISQPEMVDIVSENAERLKVAYVDFLAVGYRLTFPHLRQVITTVVPLSGLMRTLQFAPGTKKLLQPLQVNRFNSRGILTPHLIPIRLAIST